MKSINHKGAQAYRNSPVGYFSEGARLQGVELHKGHKELKSIDLTLYALSLLCVLCG
jgi:hypothetical protein